MEYQKLKFRDLFAILVSENRILFEHYKGNEKYSQLLRELIKHDIDGFDPLPNQKEIMKTLGLGRPQLMELMQELYSDFRELLNNPQAYPITDTEIKLYFQSIDDFWSIGVKELDVIPRVGEDFIFWFAGAGTLGGRSFKVESITHDLENGIHRITIHLHDHLYRSSEEEVR